MNPPKLSAQAAKDLHTHLAKEQELLFPKKVTVEITESDWEQILQIKWKPEQLRILLLLKDNQNRAVSDEESGGKITRGRINAVCNAHGLKYRIFSIHGRHGVTDRNLHRYKLFLFA